MSTAQKFVMEKLWEIGSKQGSAVTFAMKTYYIHGECLRSTSSFEPVPEYGYARMEEAIKKGGIKIVPTYAISLAG